MIKSLLLVFTVFAIALPFQNCAKLMNDPLKGWSKVEISKSLTPGFIVEGSVD